MPFRLFRLPRLFAMGSECADLRKRFSDYLEAADISEEEGERIRMHLEQCKNCNSFMETLRSTITMLGDLPGHPVPQDPKGRLFQIPKSADQGQS